MVDIDGMLLEPLKGSQKNMLRNAFKFQTRNKWQEITLMKVIYFVVIVTIECGYVGTTIGYVYYDYFLHFITT